jgi:hypothetical protein
MDAQVPEDVSPLQTATAAIHMQAEKLGHSDDWKSFKTDNGLCKFYFDPALAGKLMEAGQSGVIKDFFKAELNENNSFVANGNIKELINSSDDIKQIFKQETISKSGWDWTNDNENSEAFKQRSAITLGSSEKPEFSNLDEFQELFGGNTERGIKTPTIAELKAQKEQKIFNDSMDEFQELFSRPKTGKAATLSSLENKKDNKSKLKY